MQNKKIKIFAGIFIVLTLMFSMMINSEMINAKDTLDIGCYKVTSLTANVRGIDTNNDIITATTIDSLSRSDFVWIAKEEAKKAKIDNREYVFVKISYKKNNMEKEGWVAKTLIISETSKKTKGECLSPSSPPETKTGGCSQGFKEQEAQCDPDTQIKGSPEKITKDDKKTYYCCQDKPTITKTPEPSFFTRIKWQLEELCMGESKDYLNKKDELKYFKESNDCLSSLGNSNNGDFFKNNLTYLNQIKNDKNEIIKLLPQSFKASEETKNEGYRAARDCINKISQLQGFISDEGKTIFKEGQTVGGLKNALIDNDGPLTKKINDLDNEIKNWDETHRARGWRSVERYYSLISCAYGLAGGIMLASGSGDCREETAYPGVDHCEKCDDYMPFMPCTAERCGILGNCRAIAREDGKGYMCLPGECVGESSRIPVVNQMDMIWYQGRLIINDTDRINARTFNRNTNTDLIDGRIEGNVNYLVNTLNLTITLQGTEGGKCRYSFENGTAFASMTGNFEENWKYPITQSALIDLSGLALGRSHTIYIKCESTCGSINEPSDDSQYVKFTFEPRPDALPPEIVRVVPDPNTQYLNNASRYATIEVWLNENGYCKYSTINETGLIGTNLTTKWNQTFTNSSYMAQMFVQGAAGIQSSPGDRVVHNIINTTCLRNQPCGYTNELGSFSLYRGINNCTICYVTIDTSFGFEEIDWDAIAAESAVLSQQDQNLRNFLDERGLTALGLTGKSKLFHYKFRCADFGRNGQVGADDNIMPEEETYDYQIFTYPPFNMTIIEPRNNGNYYLPVPLKVETSRETVCKYIACPQGRICNNTWENMLYIYGEDSYNILHEKELENLTYGRNTIYVRCRDRGNLEVMNSTTINVLQDLTSPMIIRMSHGINDNALLIETDEKAECVVSFDKLKGCAYNFSSGSPFMTSDGYVHAYTWIPSSLHYVKCKDRWNNYPGGRMDSNICTAVIDPIHIPEI